MAMIIWRSVPYSGGQGLGREAAQVGAKTPIPSALEKPSNWAVVRQKPCQVFFLGFRRIFLISLRLPDGVTHHPRTLPASELLECIPVKVYHRFSLFQGGGHFRRVKLKPGLCHAKHDGGFGSSVQGCERLRHRQLRHRIDSSRSPGAQSGFLRYTGALQPPLDCGRQMVRRFESPRTGVNIV